MLDLFRPGAGAWDGRGGLGEARVRIRLLGEVGADTGRGERADVGPPKCQVLLAALALLLPRWRRHTRTEATRGASDAALDAADAARLDEDLARFD